VVLGRERFLLLRTFRSVAAGKDAPAGWMAIPGTSVYSCVSTSVHGLSAVYDSPITSVVLIWNICLCLLPQQFCLPTKSDSPCDITCNLHSESIRSYSYLYSQTVSPDRVRASLLCTYHGQTPSSYRCVAPQGSSAATPVPFIQTI
jgi:hypothetical protein